MSHELCVVAHPPGFPEFGFDLEELGIGIFEHLFVALVPSVACRQIAQRQDVGGFAHGGLPPDGVSPVGGAGVDIAVTHFGNHDVAHGHFEIWIVVHDLLELVGVARHVIILQG